jgi:hypothetical protein
MLTSRRSATGWGPPDGARPGPRVPGPWGPATARRAAGTSGVAHPAQNFAPGGFVVPHAGQGAVSGVAHSVQNRAPGPLSVPQLEQVATAMASRDAVRSSVERAKDTGPQAGTPASNGFRVSAASLTSAAIPAGIVTMPSALHPGRFRARETHVPRERRA